MELHRWLRGGGNHAQVLCLHETASSADVWSPLAEALGERVRTIAYDRRGWGRSEAPEPYTRTTIGEQAEDAAALLRELDAAPAVLCGAGLGAAVALDLLVRRAELAVGAILIEPPLLAFVPGATKAISEDVEALRDAVDRGGPGSALDLYLSGTLRALGAGAERLPSPATAPSRDRPLSLFAELAAMPAWPLPIAEMALARLPSLVVVSRSTPPLVRHAADALVRRLTGTELREVSGSGLPHADSPDQVAQLVLEIGAAS